MCVYHLKAMANKKYDESNKNRIKGLVFSTLLAWLKELLDRTADDCDNTEVVLTPCYSKHPDGKIR